MSQLRNAIIANLGGGTPPSPIIDDGIYRFTVNVPTGGVSFTAFTVNSTPSVNDYIVDWGDGTTSVKQTSHTYSAAGQYQIGVQAGASGNFPFIKFTNNQNLISVDSVMPYVNYLYMSDMFSGSSISSVCAGLFMHNSQIDDCGACFKNCANITTVPSDICSYFTNATWLNYFFSGSNITTVPSGLLDNCVNLVQVQNMFNSCANLESVPEYLFRYNMKITSFDGVFQNCPKLKLNRNIFCDEDTEKGTRFAWTNNWFYFTNAFNRTSYTNTEQGTAPALWEYTITKSQKGNCFSGAGNSATSLSNYSLIPSAWGGPA